MLDKDLFPPEARVVYLRTSTRAADGPDLSNYQDLHPEERVVVSRAVDSRKGEFGDARWCAHQALKELGADSMQAVLKGERGMPLWPEGYTGSLTHTDGLRMAVAAPTDSIRSMGIDASPRAPPRGRAGSDRARQRTPVGREAKGPRQPLGGPVVVLHQGGHV